MRTMVAKVKILVALHRRLVAAVMAGLAVVLLVGILRAPEPEGMPVVRVRAEVAAGTEVGADDVELARIPPDLVPTGARTDPAAATGELAAVRLTPGMVLRGDDLVADGAARDGERLVPVRLSDPAVADLLRPGMTVTLVAVDQAGPRKAAGRARIITVHAGDGGTEFAARSDGVLVVVAVPEREAIGLAGTMGQRLTVLLD